MICWFAVSVYRGDDRIIRASRHYERAGQILTRLSVATARQFILGTPYELPAIGQRITVTAPIRVDFSGAWSDTPPQAYEWGGAVITVALTINKEVYPLKFTNSLRETVLFILHSVSNQSCCRANSRVSRRLLYLLHVYMYHNKSA